MMWRKTVELLKLCNTPVSIISPFPLFAISLFLISRKEPGIFDLHVLFAGILISLLSNFGSNLWNHCNDLKEDIAQGKQNILTRDASMQKTALIISVMLYIISMVLVYIISIELKRSIYIYFFIWAFATWWYSDNLILKKITGFRLKDSYSGEFVTYSIAWPMYTLSIWTIYSDLNIMGLSLSIAFFFLSLAGLLLKDLKDISGDRKAGLRTFGVIFLPSQLIKYSCYLMVVYYIVMLNTFFLNYYTTGFILYMLPFLYFFKNTFVHMYKKNWKLDAGDLKAIKSIGSSIYLSVLFIGIIPFF